MISTRPKAARSLRPDSAAAPPLKASCIAYAMEISSDPTAIARAVLPCRAGWPSISGRRRGAGPCLPRRHVESLSKQLAEHGLVREAAGIGDGADAETAAFRLLQVVHALCQALLAQRRMHALV